MRPKHRESTLCTYTECGSEIKEGDILEYGDNYRCVVLYNVFEARFDAIEFGYKKEGYLYRAHEIGGYSTLPWKISGNVDDSRKLLKGYPKNFNYTKELSRYYP